MTPPRLVLAGTHSGAGKTSVSAALMAAFTRQGLCVQAYKAGPDYIDPAFHQFVTGRPSRNLDSWMLPEAALASLFRRHAPAEGLSLIEGVMGLFDGQGTGHAGSTAHVAEILGAPVVLTVDGRGLSRSSAALVAGYRDFSPGLNLAGVILNRLSGERHYALLRGIIEDQAKIPCFGYLPDNGAFRLERRHLGLVPAEEVADLAARVKALAQAAQETLNLDGLLDLARQAAPFSLKAPLLQEAPLSPQMFLAPRETHLPVRLGVARDEAFSFYYQDNLDMLAERGAELIFFSPLRDSALPPALGGLYLGGGFPEVFAEGLAANASLRAQVREALEGGMPAYAECGGLMYLCESLIDAQKKRHAMAGFFPECAEMTGRLQRFGYVELSFSGDTVLGPAGTRVRAHEFHHSRLTEGGAAAEYAVIAAKPDGAHWPDGLRKKQTLAGYAHIHFAANPALADHFVERCRVFAAMGATA